MPIGYEYSDFPLAHFEEDESEVVRIVFNLFKKAKIHFIFKISI